MMECLPSPEEQQPWGCGFSHPALLRTNPLVKTTSRGGGKQGTGWGGGLPAQGAEGQKASCCRLSQTPFLWELAVFCGGALPARKGLELHRCGHLILWRHIHLIGIWGDLVHLKQMSLYQEVFVSPAYAARTLRSWTLAVQHPLGFWLKLELQIVAHFFSEFSQAGLDQNWQCSKGLFHPGSAYLLLVKLCYSLLQSSHF